MRPLRGVSFGFRFRTSLASPRRDPLPRFGPTMPAYLAEPIVNRCEPGYVPNGRGLMVRRNDGCGSGGGRSSTRPTTTHDYPQILSQFLQLRSDVTSIQLVIKVARFNRISSGTRSVKTLFVGSPRRVSFALALSEEFQFQGNCVTLEEFTLENICSWNPSEHVNPCLYDQYCTSIFFDDNTKGTSYR